ncbi:ribosome maturation factor RimP [Corynebacterium sp.]|uniref:ribosome maturation factor RimP n=1 Tax=Corynebacterium sp. TaxID=1720 RepID=UPI0027BAB82C|nr:ribosome maturation factor RimP [Corynebacterium sp.]
MAFPSTTQLQEALEPIVSAFQLDIEHIKVTRAGKKSQVGIYLDGDQRPDSDLLEKLAQHIGEELDAREDVGDMSFGPGYTLEVSTPGLDMPLSAPRHWRRNRHRLVAVQLDGQGTPEIWRIGALADDETAVILVPTKQSGVGPAGSGNKKSGGQASARKRRDPVALELASSVHAVVEIEFSQPPRAELEVTEQSFARVEIAETISSATISPEKSSPDSTTME